jgi:hypothetical protein
MMYSLTDRSGRFGEKQVQVQVGIDAAFGSVQGILDALVRVACRR